MPTAGVVGGALVAALLVAPAPANAAERPPLRVGIVTADQATLQKRGEVKASVTARRAGPVRLLVKVRRGHRDPSRRGPSTVAASGVVAFRKAGTRKVSLKLTRNGRRRVDSDVRRCRSIEVMVSGKSLAGRTRAQRRKVRGSRVIAPDARRCAGTPAADEAPPPFEPPRGAEVTRDESDVVVAAVTNDSVILASDGVLRRWDRGSFRTTELRDRRSERVWSRDSDDFTLAIGDAQISSREFRVTSVEVKKLSRSGLRVEMQLAPRSTGELPRGFRATRVAEAYPGVAGLRMQTILESPVPLPLGSATLDEAAVGAGVAPAIHALRAGADWRDPDYTGPPPPFQVGDPHAGTWRDTRSANAGQSLEGPAQWLSAQDGRQSPSSQSLFIVMEQSDFPSSRAAYDGRTARLRLDWSRDVVLLGPFEEDAHVENPVPVSGGRPRVIRPGRPFELQPSFIGMGLGNGDEAWQHHRYLTEHRLAPYPRQATFNSNGTDANRISTGAKDDMDFATVQQVAPIARRLGIETFILDDGWQAISGDWYPDSPDHPEPRWDGTPTSKFKPRFPDSRFEAVREAIKPMKLGLWMSPMHFHNESQTFQQHPDWACTPVGQSLAVVNALQPGSGSNEAGIGTWGPAAIPHVESRIREAIEGWGVTYFKFDFLVWLDCAGQGDFHDYKDAFVDMLDRLQRDHPEVTFQIDETNDYRLFPFESVARGPSWFQNGKPPPDRLLHNLWNLSPFVPSWSLGQHFLGDQSHTTHPISTLMAAALLSHMTFFSNLGELPESVIDQAAPWLAFHRAHRELFGGVVHPLIDDPLKKDWTALQSWDPLRARGALLAFRQESTDGSREIALRNVPPGRRFRLREAPSGRAIGTASSEELAGGLRVSIAEPRGARVLLIEPIGD